MQTWLQEWRAINGHSVKQPFYEHSACKWGRLRRPQPPRAVKFEGMRSCLKEWRAINGHSVRQPFYEHCVCKWGGSAPPYPPPPPVLFFILSHAKLLQ